MSRKLLHIIMMLLVTAGLLVLLGLTAEHNLQHQVSQVHVFVDESCGNHFLVKEHIGTMIADHFGPLENKPLQGGTLHKIRQLVEGNPFVKRAAVYRSIDGDLHIDIIQRNPLLRVMDSRGQGYYVDREGMSMPLSRHYTARVMVASGYIQTTYNQDMNLLQHKPSELISASEKRQRWLFELARYIDNDPLWRSMIDQIWVNQSGSFELIPMNGAHVIAFGDISDMETKFEKLRLFYMNGISQVGWNYYKRINLKYDRQIVCSK